MQPIKEKKKSNTILKMLRSPTNLPLWSMGNLKRTLSFLICVCLHFSAVVTPSAVIPSLSSSFLSLSPSFTQRSLCKYAGC